MRNSASMRVKIRSTATSGARSAMGGWRNRHRAVRDFGSRARLPRRLMASPINLRWGKPMKSRTLWLVGAAAVWCAMASTAAAEGTRAERGADCSVETKGLKGEERERALTACQKEHEGEGDGGHSQQNRMKACNSEAGRKELRGDERRAFMSSCLKNK
jgi:hypothetical protein